MNIKKAICFYVKLGFVLAILGFAALIIIGFNYCVVCLLYSVISFLVAIGLQTHK